MAQRRLRDFKEPITSFQHNVFNLGLHNPGRYNGFDTMVRTAALVFKLQHIGTGLSYKNQINDNVGPTGVIVSPQGVLIMEDAELTGFALDTNVGNAKTRYDALVCQHNYTVVDGGEDATYFILKGPVNNPIKPVLADPSKQVIVGIIEIPTNAPDINDMRYIKAKCPDSGDGEDARLNDTNIFSRLQGQKRSDTNYPADGEEHTSGAHVAKLWKLEDDGNTFQFLDSVVNNTIDGIMIKNVPLQQGIRIHILINHYFQLRESTFFLLTSFYGDGFRPLKINPGLGNEVLSGAQSGGGSLLAIRPALNEVWDIGLVFLDDAWYVTSIGGAGGSSSFRRGMQIEVYTDIVLNFDVTGLGVNLMAGWAICNGNNQTPDRRGKMTVMATNVPAAGRPSRASAVVVDGLGDDPEDFIYSDVYDEQGKSKFGLSVANLPDYILPMNDPGHVHNILGQTGGDNNDNDNIHRFAGADKHDSDTGFFFTNNTACQVGLTGVTAESGGSNEKKEHIPPVWATVYIMKL